MLLYVKDIYKSWFSDRSWAKACHELVRNKTIFVHLLHGMLHSPEVLTITTACGIFSATLCATSHSLTLQVTSCARSYIFIKKNASLTRGAFIYDHMKKRTHMMESMIFLWRHRRQDIVEPSWLGGGVPNQKRAHRLQLFHCILKYNAHERSQFLFEVLIFPLL